MQLLVQVLGAIAAGLLVWVLARSVGMSGRPAAATVAVVAIVAGALISVPNLRDAIASFAQQRHANETLSGEQKRVLAGSFIEPNQGFLDWAKERIAPGEEFQLILTPSAQSEQLAQWSSYELEPRVGVESVDPGGWVVFYGVPPSTYGPGSGYGEAKVYEPGFAIARSEHVA